MSQNTDMNAINPLTTMKLRILGQPDDLTAFLTLLPSIADVTADSGLRRPRNGKDGRLYRYLTLRRPIRSDTSGGLAGTSAALRAVLDERMRQLAKWGVQRRADSIGRQEAAALVELLRAACQNVEAGHDGEVSWAYVLGQEVGEALAVSEPVQLRSELIKVAAVAVAWIEDLDSTLAWIEDLDSNSRSAPSGDR